MMMQSKIRMILGLSRAILKITNKKIFQIIINNNKNNNRQVKRMKTMSKDKFTNNNTTNLKNKAMYQQLKLKKFKGVIICSNIKDNFKSLL